MRSKDKNKKRFRLTIKNIIIMLSVVLFVIYLFIFYNYFLMKTNKVYAKETKEIIQISNANKIDIDKIINENIENKNKYKEEITVEESDLEYLTKYRNNAKIPKGQYQVLQEGREGKQEKIIKRTYENNEMIKEEYIGNRVIKASLNKIIEVGTGPYVKNTKVKVGDKIYVTSYQVSVMEEPSEESNKVATLQKDSEMKVLEINKDWYKINSSGNRGYVKKENTTNKAVEKVNDKIINHSNNKKQPLSFNMALNKPSGLSMEEFKKVLTDSRDKNKIFENNSQYFYYIEQQYNINGLFVAAVGIHESAWGTSKIAREKHNLFGYGAYDSNPYNGAYDFSDFSESIDLVARVFTKYYLNPKGTPIYGGEKAAGTYYNSPNLSGVNKRYATDKNWANSVYKNMKYLYNKL